MQPSDEALYAETKKKVDKIYDKPSAYRSMAYTRFYLRAFREKYGSDKKAYKGKKPPGELEKWRREKWVDIRSFLDTPEAPKPCGGIEYGRKEYPLCMPIAKAKRYNKNELLTLLNRKAELGKTRLVKESFLKQVEPEEKPVKPIKTKIVRGPGRPRSRPDIKRVPKIPREKAVRKPTKREQIAKTIEARESIPPGGVEIKFD
jgi:hypothetical protein